MANHQSSKKRMRQDEKKRLTNRYNKKSTRTSIARLKEMTDGKEAQTLFPKVVSMIDKLAKSNQWHKNKAANVKGKLQKFVSSLAS
jgi:small subunit ribosomal protein S20